MDFFDPQKQKRHAIRLGVGYALIGLALALATTILLYQAYGFGIDRSGKVIQNGLVFLSSQPEGGNIYVNGHLYKSQTNTRMVLPAGQYKVRIARDGYRSWQRALTVEGGSVERFDYPFFFPSKLVTAPVAQDASAVSFSTQSPDRRWLLQAAGPSNAFGLYDLRAAKPAAKAVAIPEDILSAGTTTGYQLAAWADDNRHVVLRRTYQKDATSGSEYILFDRQDPAQSKNLTQVLGFTPSVIELRKGNYDNYFLYDQANGTVFTASLKKPTPQLYLEHVLAFTSDENAAVYVTAQAAPAGKVYVQLRQGDDAPLTLRTLPANTPYLIDLAIYDGTPYVAAGAQSENKVYVYQDPVAVLRSDGANVPAPVQILKVQAPTYVVFSPNARFVMAENNDRFAVYDAETDKGYAYQLKAPLDAAAGHAYWMDGYHLDAVGGGKLQVFDFDGANPQALMPADPAYLPAFSPNYHMVYTVNTQRVLTGTALLAPQDQ